MLQVRPNNGMNDTAFCCIRKPPVVDKPSRRTLVAIRPWDARQETGISRQVRCRELTTVAAVGSERPLTANPARDRVDFIPQCGQSVLRYGLSGLLGLSRDIPR